MLCSIAAARRAAASSGLSLSALESAEVICSTHSRLPVLYGSPASSAAARLSIVELQRWMPAARSRSHSARQRSPILFSAARHIHAPPRPMTVTQPHPISSSPNSAAMYSRPLPDLFSYRYLCHISRLVSLAGLRGCPTCNRDGTRRRQGTIFDTTL